jgi:phage terminase large subunit-like protein
MSGRGWGKTRTGSEWLIDSVLAEPIVNGEPTEWMAMGQTFGDVRDVCLEGPSGLLSALKHRGLIEDEDYIVNRGAWQIHFAQGQKIYLMGAKDADVGRGYNLSGAWLDEFAKWRYADRLWIESLAPALRVGRRPRAVVTTTPKVTVKQLPEWLGRNDGSVHVTKGSTFDNRHNLSAAALHELRIRYEGTLIGRQELYGELITDTEGALWTAAVLEKHRLRNFDYTHPYATLIAEIATMKGIWDTMSESERTEEMDTVHVPVQDGRPWVRYVGVDPPGTTAECGIVVGTAPRNGAAGRDHAVILDDLTVTGPPEAWGRQVVTACRKWQCHGVVVEQNQGGDMVRSTIHNIDSSVTVRKVHASQSKFDRAEPVSALYARGWIHHLDFLPALEEQITTWTPDDSRSPDRMDALVHLCVALLKPMGQSFGTLSSPTPRRLPNPATVSFPSR